MIFNLIQEDKSSLKNVFTGKGRIAANVPMAGVESILT
jgi:hypothetical protein